MSEYLEDAEIHETPDAVELRWSYNGREYGVLMASGMFDLLQIAEGMPVPILTKLMRPVVKVDGDIMNVEVQL